MVSANPKPATEQLPLPTLLGLFLVPGALMTIVYVVIAPFIETAGFPPIAALLVAPTPTVSTPAPSALLFHDEGAFGDRLWDQALG